MGTLGDRFRRERELRGIALSEIAAKTHIGARMLQAIEEEAYERLPGGIFNKSFIRQYAEYLGLDHELAVRDYVRSTAAREVQPAPAPEPFHPAEDGFGTMTRVAVAAVVLAVVGLGGYLVHRRTSAQPPVHKVAANSQPPSSAASRSGSESQSAASPEPPPALTARHSAEPLSPPAELGPVNSEGEPLQQAPPSLSPQTAASAQPPASPRGAAAASPSATQVSGTQPSAVQASVLASANTAKSGELLLQINAHSSVWISVTADGEKKWQGTLQANQSREIQATDTIRLTAGNAGGVSLILNGKDIGAMGNEGEVKTITLAARALGEPVP